LLEKPVDFGSELIRIPDKLCRPYNRLLLSSFMDNTNEILELCSVNFMQSKYYDYKLILKFV